MRPSRPTSWSAIRRRLLQGLAALGAIVRRPGMRESARSSSATIAVCSNGSE